MAREPNNRDGGRGRRDRDESPEFADRLVAINRVSKTTKGGKNFGFAALVVGYLAQRLPPCSLGSQRCTRFLCSCRRALWRVRFV